MHDHIPRRGNVPEFLTDWVEQHRLPVDGNDSGPPRAAIYARRSVADPRFVSISRQVAVSESHCRHIGAVHDSHSLLFIDRHRSGTTMSGRVSLMALLSAARERLFDILVVQGIDRLTRNSADAAVIVAEFEILGIAIHVAGTGLVAGEEVVLKAFQYQKELDSLVARICRGYRDAAESGLLIGSRSRYGYDRLPSGTGLIINVEEAQVLKRCFESIDAGVSRSELAAQLNAEGIPGPCGKPWLRSTFHRGDGSGQLQNTLVKGLWTWDRHAVKPVTIEVPDLAVIDVPLFERVNSKLDDARTRAAPPRGVRVLSHVVRCTCGAPLLKTGRGTLETGRMACRSPFDEGRCMQRSSIAIVEAERRYLRFIHDEILAPSQLVVWQSIRDRAFEEILRSAEADRLDLVRRIEDVARRMDEADDESGQEGWLLAYMGNLEKEYHDLWRSRDRIESPVRLQVDEKEAGRLRATIAEMVRKVPYRVTDPAEVEAVARMHQLVPRMVVESSKDGFYDVRYLLGVSSASGGPSLPDVESDLWIARRHPVPPRGALRRPERIIHFHGLAAQGMFGFSEPEWTAIRHLFVDAQLPAMEPRAFAEALVFLAVSRLPPSMLPERYEGFQDGRDSLCSYRDTWLAMIGILEEQGSRLVEHVDRRRFAPLWRA